MKKSFGERLKSLFSKSSNLDDDFYDNLIDILVEGDIGAKTAYLIVEELEKICSKEKMKEENQIVSKLK